MPETTLAGTDAVLDGPGVPAKARRPDPLGIGRLLRTVSEAVEGDTGASARLRRLDPEDEVGSPSLHTILARSGHGGPRMSPDDLRRYACSVRIVAILARVGGEGRGMHPGAAFAEMEVSEQRLARLSTARDEALQDLLTGLVRRAASTGVRMNPWALCEAILGEARDDGVGEAARRDILFAYYRVLDARTHAKTAA